MVQLDQISKRYLYEWVFKDISYEFEAGKSYALLGSNGSGKSTLLNIIAGSLSPSKGEIHYHINGQKIEVENIFKHLSISAPYLELINEYSLNELILFYRNFKKLPDLTPAEIAEILQLENDADKLIKFYSSGMQQRAKLGLALLTETPLLLLDEPTSNLDTNGINWYRSMIEKYCQDKLLIIASNQKHEYDFCDEVISVEDFKNFD